MIDVRQLAFRYAGAQGESLRDINWRIEPGEFVLVAGQSGSGKSTLLRCLNGLIPHFHGGYFAGDVTVFGRNTRARPPRQLATTIGTVFQDPETQLVTDSPEDEIIFTLENLGFDAGRILKRLNEIFHELGIEHLRERRISTLSGGERQMVALAAALAANPRALLLDEPTSQLDLENSQQVIDAFSRQNQDSGLTVLLAEHRFARLLPVATGIAHMRSGRLTVGTGPAAIQALYGDGLMPPQVAHLSSRSTLGAGRAFLSISRLDFSYGESQVLRGIDLDIRAGETIALNGPNGSGKTTLLKQIIGMVRPAQGQIALDGKDTRQLPIQEIARSVGYVPQHPTIMLHQETVADELRFTLQGLQRNGDIGRTLAALGLSGYEQRHPLDLSGGERQRLAVAAIAVASPRLLLLDEPTRGLPWSAKRDLALLLRGLAADGAAIVVASHDEDFCRHFADRRIGLSEGRLVLDEARTASNLAESAEDQDVTPLLTGSNLD